MKVKKLCGAVALSVAVGLVVTTFPQTGRADGPASVQLLAFMVPIKRPKGVSKDADFPKEAPITITLEIYDGSQVGAICELAPRIRDAVMETLYYHPIPMKRNRKMVFKRVIPKLVRATNKALRGDFVSDVVIEAGAKQLKTGSSRSRANALGCGVVQE